MCSWAWLRHQLGGFSLGGTAPCPHTRFGPLYGYGLPAAPRTAYYAKYSTSVRNCLSPYETRANKIPVSPGCHTTLGRCRTHS